MAGAKRKRDATASKPPSSSPGPPENAELGRKPNALEHPRNHRGWRYLWAKAAPFAADAFVTDAALPFEPGTPPTLSSTDASAMVRLSDDLRSAASDRGFGSVRGALGVRAGAWYWEVRIDRANDGGSRGPHVRVGWARREASLEAPVGYDSYSYGYRDVGGERVHESFRRAYGAPFATGDVIGVYISLPQSDAAFFAQSHAAAARTAAAARPDGTPASAVAPPLPPRSLCAFPRDRILIRYRGSVFFEAREYAPVNAQPAIAADAADALRQPEGRRAAAAAASAAGVPPALLLPAAPADGAEATPVPRRGSGAGSAQSLAAFEKLTSAAFPCVPGSRICFFKNGVPQGAAFVNVALPCAAVLMAPENVRLAAEQRHRRQMQREEAQIYGGIPLMPVADDGSLGYYPMVSCYRDGAATANFGPDFSFIPPVASIGELGHDYFPLSARYGDESVENAVADVVDIVAGSLA